MLVSLPTRRSLNVALTLLRFHKVLNFNFRGSVGIFVDRAKAGS